MRLSQTTTSGGTSTPGYYTYNAHSDVEAVTGAAGTTTATYGYTAYGSPVTSMFTGADKNDAQPSQTTQPYSAYRFNAMRWDSGTGQYNMGFRTYDPGLNQFISRDMYDGALANMGLTTDPFTGSSYAYGYGNPISNIENNGHMACAGPGTSDCSVQGGPEMAPKPYSPPPTSGTLPCGLLCQGAVAPNPNGGNNGTPSQPPSGCANPQIAIFCNLGGANQNDGTQPGQGNDRFNVSPIVCASLTAGMGISCNPAAAAGGASGSSGGSGGEGPLGGLLRFLGLSDAIGAGGVDLEAAEAAGGHTIARHVGLTIAELIARNIPLASTFTDLSAAETATADNIVSNELTIVKWLSGTSPRLVITAAMDPSEGIIYDRATQSLISPSEVQTVLIRTATGFNVLTSFPIP